MCALFYFRIQKKTFRFAVFVVVRCKLEWFVVFLFRTGIGVQWFVLWIDYLWVDKDALDLPGARTRISNETIGNIIFERLFTLKNETFCNCIWSSRKLTHLKKKQSVQLSSGKWGKDARKNAHFLCQNLYQIFIITKALILSIRPCSRPYANE